MHDESPPTGFNGESWYDEETGITYTQMGSHLYGMKDKNGAILDDKFISGVEVIKKKSLELQKTPTTIDKIGKSVTTIGIVSDRHVRHPIQNILAHSWFSPQPGFEVLKRGVFPYLQYQTKNKFTSW